MAIEMASRTGWITAGMANLSYATIYVIDYAREPTIKNSICIFIAFVLSGYCGDKWFSATQAAREG